LKGNSAGIAGYEFPFITFAYVQPDPERDFSDRTNAAHPLDHIGIETEFVNKNFKGRRDLN